MRKVIVAFFMCGLCFAAKDLKGHLGDKEYNDLDDIVNARYFRVLTTRSSFDYYIYQGKHHGYQYELMKEFTKGLNKKFVKKGELHIQFELIPVDYDQLIPMLLAGKGDVIAANLTIKPSREERVAFSRPLREVRELLVTRKELKNKNPYQKKIAVRKSSSYYQSIRNWNIKHKEKFFLLDDVNEDLAPEDILDLLSKKKFDYTVVDSNIYEVASKVYPNLVLSETQPFKAKKEHIALAVRKDSKELLKALNEFVPRVKKGSFLGNVINQKYFNDSLYVANQNMDNTKISPYDNLLKKYGKKYDWDWKLLASLAFQESRFNASIVNRWGAIGLFQIKQATANEPYVNIKRIRGKSNVENNVHAGVKYLSWLRDTFFKDLPRQKQIRLALAAYNAGPGRLKKARRLAKKMGLNPNIWFRNVELALVKMRKIEPVNYVSEINKRYVGYTLLMPN
ncbi:MAG: lytic transglycosylase F [Halobacteriovoraceae bacterium]|nr:lytic transglycosylase F [Halobacteriovoraceae bacterium]|tara:strand:+ start:104302 stop:105657 length:1356 start_codon:yes stop_codon:yes gene_type:complete